METTQQALQETKNIRTEYFVSSVIQQCKQDKGLAARLRRADNPATEYQSWELLAAHDIDLERDDQRLPFITVAATIARAKSEGNGSLRLGQASTHCYTEGRDSTQAAARLRRLLACDDLPEVCRILRPLLSLIASKVGQTLDYTRLLRQLLRFRFDPQGVKAQWAQEFYARSVSEQLSGEKA